MVGGQCLGPVLAAMGAKKSATESSARREAKPTKKGEDGSRKDISNMLTQLRAQASKDSNKQALLSFYQSLPRFSHAKADILSKWKMDKTCRWANEYTQQLKHSVTTSQKALSGYGTKFDISKLLNIGEGPLLEDILSQMPQDDLWDENNTMERIFKRQGLKRYHFQNLKCFSEHLEQDQVKETFESSASASSAGNSAPLLHPPTGASGGEVQVKFEVPELAEFACRATLVRSAKVVLEKLLCQALDTKFTLQQRCEQDPSLSKKLAELEQATDKLDKFLTVMRHFVARAEEVGKSKEAEKEVLEETLHAKDLSDMALAHQDGMKSLLKRVKLLL